MNGSGRLGWFFCAAVKEVAAMLACDGCFEDILAAERARLSFECQRLRLGDELRGRRLRVDDCAAFRKGCGELGHRTGGGNTDGRDLLLLGLCDGCDLSDLGDLSVNGFTNRW
jgi:hypothetical protein